MVSSLMSQKEVKLFKVSTPSFPLSCCSFPRADEMQKEEPEKKYGSGTAQAPMTEHL